MGATRPEQERGIYAERYRVEAVLGQGGMGAVLRVRDLQSGQMLALKELTLGANVGSPAQRVALFRREYHVLSQLDHPNVVRVLDYGVFGETPFYTMELLHGRSLRELAPLPWRAACGHLIDLCSALSVLHSRGFVHRDLSPSNVLVTAASETKLIDFGAMAPFGPVDAAVGTPPYMAPETLELATVDVRSDIFALGALMYWMLTGRHAFPATSFAALPECWRTPVAPISAVARDAPAALQELVASMLSVSPTVRPAHLAEVTQRLSQLLGTRTPAIRAPEVDASLFTPKLTGRDTEIKLAAAYAMAAKQGSGSSVIITGAPGMGRSRMLEAFALEAMLAGLVTAHVRLSSGQTRPLGLMRAIVASLRRIAPERAVTAAAPLIVELDPVWSESAAERAEVTLPLQQAIVQFFERFQALSPLAVCVDDIHLADIPSLQLLTRLSQLPSQPLLFVFSAPPANPTEPLALGKLRLLAEPTPMHPLDLKQTRQLLASVFGELTGLTALADWVYRSSEGRPQACVQLLHHLFACGALKHYDGRFHLSGDLDSLDLPRDVAALMLALWNQLSEQARHLVGLLALCNHVHEVHVDMLSQLVARRTSETLAFDALTDLLGHNLIKLEHDRCSFVHPGFADFVNEQLSESLRRDYAGDLALMFEALGAAGLGMAAHYHRLAGDLDKALAIMTGADYDNIEATEPVVLFARSPLGQELYEELLSYSRARNSSPAELFRYRKIMLQLAAVDAPELTRYAPETLEQLRYDLGLDQWDAFAHVQEPVARLFQCFQLAEKRWQSTIPSQRSLTPGIALKEFATCIALLVGAYVPVYETRGLDALPAMIEPLRGLAPVLDIVYRLARLSADSAVRGCFFVEQREEVIAMLREPVAGMDRITQNGAYLLAAFYLALELALRGSDAGQSIAAELEAAPMYAVLGKQLRVVMALGKADADAARRAREEREMLALQSSFTDQHRETSLRWEAVVAYRAADLLSLRELMHAVKQRAERFPGARPFLHLLRAQYLMLTSQPVRALEVLREGQALAPALQHGSWRELALLEMDALLAVNQHAEAGACAERTAATLRSAGFDPRYEDRLTATRALALAAAGELPRAKALLDASIEDFERVGPNGVAYAALCETRARVALLENDPVVFQAMAERCAAIYRRGQQPGLIARYERLARAANQVFPLWTLSSQHQAFQRHVLDVPHAPFASADAAKQEQFRQLLRIAIDETGAHSGYLYEWQPEAGLRQLAARGGAPIQPELVHQLTQFVVGLSADQSDQKTTLTGSTAQGLLLVCGDQSYVPIVLRHYRDHSRVLGILAVRSSQWVALDRGLLDMLTQTLAVLLTTPDAEH